MVISRLEPHFQLIRLRKPVGVLLLYIPCLWGMALSGTFEWGWGLLFLWGAFSMRSFGCIINDYFDRDFDGRVERTQGRPLPKGLIRTRQIIWPLVITLLSGFLVFIILNGKAQLTSLLGLGAAITYPLMKRYMNWPQLFLGFTFNVGILVGYVNQTDLWPTTNIWLIYLAGVCWTIAYDTIYALQDYEDDIKLGIGTTTRYAIYQPHLFVGFFYALMMGLIVANQLPQSHASFILLGVIFAYTLFKVKTWRPNVHEDSQSFFEANVIIGLLWLFYFIESF